MILSKDLARIHSWLIICGSNDFHRPGTKHELPEVVRLFYDWSKQRSEKQLPVFLVTSLTCSSGNVTFVRENSGAVGVFAGFLIQGVTLYPSDTTRNLLREFGSILLRAVGQDALEFQHHGTIWCLRRTDLDKPNQ